jgi:hypothetical protein
VERQETGWFLAHTPVGPSDGGSTKRAIKNKKRRLVINSPVQKNYAKNMNGVDRNDRDSADYTTSIRINRWYLRIFFCAGPSDLLVLHHRRLPASGLKPAWNKYRSQLTGRYDQVDLAIALIDYCILAGLKAPYEADKPKWMRQKKVIPCRCGVCFFCVKARLPYHSRPQEVRHR